MTSPTTARPPTRDALRAAVAALLEVEPGTIGFDDDLIGLGMDSIQMMRLVNQWRRTGVRVSSRVLSAEPTLTAWARHLDELRAGLAAEAAEPAGSARPSAGG